MKICLRLVPLLVGLLTLLPTGGYATQHEGVITPADSLITQTSTDEGIRLTAPREGALRLVQRSTYVGIGGLLLGNGYLSPLRYGGTSYSLLSQRTSLGLRRYDHSADSLIWLERTLPLQADRRWMQQHLWGIDLGLTDNPARNGSIYALALRYDWSYLRRWQWHKQHTLAVGPSLGFYGGGMYSNRNGNNPATLDLSLGLGLSALYAYRLPSKRFPALLRTYLRGDLLSVAFAQEFGESFYELYYYNQPMKRFRLAHPGQLSSLYLLSSIDLPLWRFLTLSLGYRWDWRRQDLQQQRVYRSQHSFVIGITTTSLPLSGRVSNAGLRSLAPF